MNFLKRRVSSAALLLALAAAMPSVIDAQTPMTEIPLGSGGGGTVQGFIEGDLGGGGTAAASNAGPEAVAFDGTYVWVATQFNDKITRIRVSDNSAEIVCHPSITNVESPRLNPSLDRSLVTLCGNSF